MRRLLVGAALTASLTLSGCAVSDPGQSAAPVARQIETAQPATVPDRPTPSDDSPDPAAIRRVPQPVDAPAPVLAEVAGIGRIDVLPVGTTADGQAEIPEDIAKVGWYRYGAAPGDFEGSVVLMGHRDSRGGKGALFPLPTVAVGSPIVVTDAEGVQHRYRVVANDSIAKRVVPLAELFARQGPPVLVLISCGGPYVKEQGGYLDNVVVTAVPA